MTTNLFDSATPANVGTLLTMTANKISDSTENLWLRKYVTLNYLRNQCKKEVDGGSRIEENLSYDYNRTVDFYSPNAVIRTDDNETATKAFFNSIIQAGSVSITDSDLAENSGKAKLADLIQYKEDNLVNSMLRAQAAALWTISPASTQPISIPEILSESDPGRGALGGIARATYTWWQSNVTGSAGSFAAAGLQLIRSMIMEIAENMGDDEPDFAVTTSTIFGYIIDTMQNKVMLEDKEQAKAGFKAFKYNNTTFTYDQFCPSGYIAFLNKKYIKYRPYTKMNMVRSPYKKPYNQLAMTRQIAHKYNLTATDPNKMGLLTGVTE